MILLDTHIVLGFFNLTDFEIPDTMRDVLNTRDDLHVSVASIWEIALKYEKGRLSMPIAPRHVPNLLTGAKVRILEIASLYGISVY